MKRKQKIIYITTWLIIGLVGIVGAFVSAQMNNATYLFSTFVAMYLLTCLAIKLRILQ